MKKLICAVTVLTVSTAQAAVINVDVANCPGPGDGSVGDPYCSIQTAIDNAVDTDEIVVAPGTYFEFIVFLGKAITLRSSHGPEVTTIHGPSLAAVQCSDSEGPETVFDGFTVTAEAGRGMFNAGSGPTVINCTFTGNRTISGGGGMANFFGSSPTVINCIFTGNVAQFGGGMANGTHSNPTVINCTFSDNEATSDGGGMLNGTGSPTVINCTFTGNIAQSGGGMFNTADSNLTVTNCTFSGNTASQGGGVYNSSEYGPTNPTLNNCVLWNNSPDQIFDDVDSAANVGYSDVEGGFPGIGNIDADPLFVDPDNGDVRLQPGSPCIDAGNNWGVSPDTADLDEDGDTLELTPWDLDGNPRFVHAAVGTHPGCGIPAVVDMGAYEFQAGKAVDIKLDDIDGDGTVNIIDLLILLASWGPCEPGCCLADLDIDGVVGITDFLILLGNWG